MALESPSFLSEEPVNALNISLKGKHRTLKIQHGMAQQQFNRHIQEECCP
jgi:hypothetical protein